MFSERVKGRYTRNLSPPKSTANKRGGRIINTSLFPLRGTEETTPIQKKNPIDFNYRIYSISHKHTIDNIIRVMRQRRPLHDNVLVTITYIPHPTSIHPMVPSWTARHPFLQKHQTRKARSRSSSSLRRTLSIASGMQHVHIVAMQLLPSSGRRALRSIHRSKRAEHGHVFRANERRAAETRSRSASIPPVI